MSGDRIKYTCKKCSWTTSIIIAWADLKPRRCMNKKCRVSFIKDPSQLEIEMPPKKEESKPAPKKEIKKEVTEIKKKKSNTKKK